MRQYRGVIALVRLLIFTFAISIAMVAQQIPANSFLVRAQSVVSGGAAIQDAVLTGKVRRVAGSDDQAGTASLKIVASGEMRLDMSFPSGSQSVVRTSTGTGLTGFWSGADGKEHPVAFQALKTDDAQWFFPPIMLTRLSQMPGVSLAETQEKHHGRAAEHLHIVQTADSRLPAYAIKLVEHADEMELFLDPITLLPSTVAFNTHPERDLGRDIPVELRFSNYRSVNGAQVPFHVQEYLNRTLVLDLEFETAQINTGITVNAR
jgi:hypothetical protein